MGQETAFKSITGGIFEFGFSDAILQVWAGYVRFNEGETPEAICGLRHTGRNSPEPSTFHSRTGIAAAVQGRKSDLGKRLAHRAKENTEP